MLVDTSSPTLTISDTGCSTILLQPSLIPTIPHLFTPGPVPPASVTVPNGQSMLLTSGGTFQLPDRPPITAYVASPDIPYSLFGTAPLLRPDGYAVYTTTTVKFFSPTSSTHFLSGHKDPHSNLWALDFPPS